MSLNHGNIAIENPKNGARAHVEKGYLFGTVDKAALSEDEISLELSGVKIPKGGQVRRVEMANTIRDRHNEVLPQPVLQKFANDINREPFSLNMFHDRSMIVGIVLPKASVANTINGATLKGFIWINEDAALPTPTTSGKGLNLISAIDNGAIKDVSIEFRGYTKYVASENPDVRGIWQYEIDPNNPDDTEFTGLAIVPKGAQRGASVVKSIEADPKKVIKKHKNMTEKLLGGGQRFTIEFKDDQMIGGDLIEKALDDMAKAKTDAETALATEKAAHEAAKSDTDEVRKALEADVLNFSKLIGDEKKAEDLQKLTLKALYDLREDVIAKHDAPETTGKKTEPKSFSHFSQLNKN